MESETIQKESVTTRTETFALAGIAAAIALLHLLTNNRYGFHRDELQFLSDARHLDWGFVAYPPFTPFIERISMSLFGLSLVGLRLFSVLAQAVVVIVAGLMARELGGGRLAQITAAIAVAFSPLAIFEGTEFQYTSFGYFWWVLISYCFIRLLKDENPRWWLAIGALTGLGLLTKYSIVFYIAGVLGGMLLTRTRRYFLSQWFWGGVAVALLIFLPNLLWQVQHGFISYHFLQSIHKRDVAIGRADGFLFRQFVIGGCALLWVPGLIGFLRSERYRLLAWMYLITLVLFWAGKGRDYYMGEAYPVLVAMGAVMGERWSAALSHTLRWVVRTTFFALLAGFAAYICAVLVPLASSGPLKDFALRRNGDLREEIGWTELVKTVADIRDSLAPEQRASVGILVGNYGEQGAIEILGQAYHLPAPISMTNSAWLRGYPEPPPSTLIMVGFSREWVDRNFTSCRLAGHNGNSEGVRNEESQYHPEIFVCGPPRKPWAEFWKENQRFG